MTTEALARINTELALRVEAYLDSSVTAPTSRALITDLLAALIPEPLSGDEREALIEQATCALIEWDTDTSDRGVRDEHYRERRADVERIFPILARNRHRGPITDETRAWVEGTLALPVYAHPVPDSYGEGVRDTLRTVAKLLKSATAEAAEAAR